MQNALEANLADVRGRMLEAARRAGRDPADISLIAVTKTHSAKIVEQALMAGITIFGENKVQEAEDKIAEIGRDRAEWHLIGRLQSNKARRAIQLFDVIHSVDSLDLARRLERICKEEDRARLRVLIEVDLAGESAKTGIAENDVHEVAGWLATCERLHLDGLMIVPPYFEDPELVRPYFRRLRSLRDALDEQGLIAGTGHLSMGMSHDFEVAIEEGATMVRVGTAIFGAR